MLMRHTQFSIWNLVEVLFVVETSAMVQHNQISPIKYGINTNSWSASRLFKNYLTYADRKMGAKNCKILLSLISVLLR
jgi:hypothetical protein